MTVRVQTFVLGVAAIALVALGAAGGYWLQSGKPEAQRATAMVSAPAPQLSERKPLYYQDPDGKPGYSTTPKMTSDGRNYKPVYGDDDRAAPPTEKTTTAASNSPRRILYYRNPMGLADRSLAPKKDSMGMDYMPVYEGEDRADVVTVSPGRMQMLGVKTARVEMRTSLSRAVQATGVIEVDESRLAVVTTKFDGYVEKLFVATTGVRVRAGQPLASVLIQTPDVISQMGSDVIARQVDYIVALQEKNPSAIEAAEHNLRNYGIPDATIAEIRQTGRAVRSIIISAPRSGTVMEKTAIEGARFGTGVPLFKLADLSTVWLIADVPEQDLGSIRTGQSAQVKFVAFPERTFSGQVQFIYPTLTPNTRTGRARVVLSNADGALLGAMYGSVTIDASAPAGGQMLVVPKSAIIDSGTAQVVLVTKGGGRFEPRSVKVGAGGDGYTEIRSGLRAGEEVVVGANFLIDAESNLRAALSTFNGAKQ
jgi:Cu(I)/Ag(I) efflux system membrane fusion protein